MQLAVDQNVPLPQDWFPAGEVDISRFDGRALGKAQLQSVDILLVRSVTPVNRGLLQGTPVRFVGSATAGTDHIATTELDAMGIEWAHAPGCNADAVVDYVLASLARLFVDPRKRRVGIVGCGQVGGRLYRRMQALGIQPLCHDPFLNEEQQPGLVPLEQLLGECDLISLHTPLTDSGPFPTRHMLDADHLSLIAPDSLLINAGRGGVVDEAALLDRLRNRHDLRLVWDVWQGEPQISRELQSYAALATPHIAGYSSRGKLRGSWMLMREIVSRFQLDWPVPAQLPRCFTDIEVPPGLNWRSAILDTYDPAEDDMRLRDAFEVEAGAGFDRLRRQYPERPELGECSSETPAHWPWGFAKPA